MLQQLQLGDLLVEHGYQTFTLLAQLVQGVLLFQDLDLGLASAGLRKEATRRGGEVEQVVVVVVGGEGHISRGFLVFEFEVSRSGRRRGEGGSGLGGEGG
jgi:hypothetical protein